MRELHERLKPIMLRRRKDQIADQLPQRVDNNYFVKMSTSQQERYDELLQPVASLVSIAKRRPLLPKEMERLQRMLSCMRMICDSVYILDQETKVAPKIDELLSILDDIWADQPDRKMIVFSEWERMLYLLAQALESEKHDYAWHTGSVAQHKRRSEINRFKNDPNCKLFLSTDSGATGLNLQAASVVVNLDLPWNPAKLEQRIARAWRKHQTNAVQVINLVTEASIEHRMLSTLSAKQELADGVLDARGKVDELQLPSTKASFLHRLEQVIESPIAKPVVGPTADKEQTPPAQRFAQALPVKLGDHLLSYRTSTDDHTAQPTAWIVVDRVSDQTYQQINELWQQTHGNHLPNSVHILDRREYQLLQKLAETGMIHINDQAIKTVFESDQAKPIKPSDATRRRQLASPLLAQAQRQFKMAQLLSDGGFEAESIAPLGMTVQLAGCALVVLCVTDLDQLDQPPTSYTATEHQIVTTHKPLAQDLLPILLKGPGQGDADKVAAILHAAEQAMTRLDLIR